MTGMRGQLEILSTKAASWSSGARATGKLRFAGNTMQVEATGVLAEALGNADGLTVTLTGEWVGTRFVVSGVKEHSPRVRG